MFSMKPASDQPLGGSFLSSGAGLWDPLCASGDTGKQACLLEGLLGSVCGWVTSGEGGVTYSCSGPIIHIPPCCFVCSRRQGGSAVEKAQEAGQGLAGQRAGGCPLGAVRRLAHPQAMFLESPALPAGRITKARGPGSPSLRFSLLKGTSACNLRQVGGEKRGRKKKKKKKGNIVQLLPPLPPPLSPPRPSRSHVTVTQRWLRDRSAGSVWGSPKNKPQPSAWSRERKALGWGAERKTTLGKK